MVAVAVKEVEARRARGLERFVDSYWVGARIYYSEKAAEEAIAGWMSDESSDTCEDAVVEPRPARSSRFRSWTAPSKLIDTPTS